MTDAPSCSEREEVGVHPAAPDDVAAGRRQGHLAEPGEQRTGQQDRRPDPGAELGIERLGSHRPGIDPDLVRARSTPRTRPGRRAARAWSRRPGCAGCCRAPWGRRPGRCWRGSAARRSCCPRAGWRRAGDDRRAPENEEAWPKLIRSVMASSGARGLRCTTDAVVFRWARRCRRSTGGPSAFSWRTPWEPSTLALLQVAAQPGWVGPTMAISLALIALRSWGWPRPSASRRSGSPPRRNGSARRSMACRTTSPRRSRPRAG